MSALDDYIENEYVKKKLRAAGDTDFTCVEAEESVIRRMLKSTEISEEIANDLTGPDFSNHDYGRIFNVIQTLVERRQGIDKITVSNAAKSIFPKNAAKIAEVVEQLSRFRPNSPDDSRNIADHVKIVKDLATRRKAIANFDKLATDLHNPECEIGEILAKMQEALDGIDIVKAEWSTMEDTLLSTYLYLEKRAKGEIKAVTSGISSLNTLLGGFFDGEMTIVGARPSAGKSAFGINIAVKAAEDGAKVGFVSCEMQKEGIGQRVLSNAAGIDGMKLRTANLEDADWDELSKGMEYMSRLGIQWLYDCNYIEDVIHTVKHKVRHKELDLVIIDYLQFMDTKRHFKDERLRVGYMTKALKRLAKSAKIPVIVLSQLTREGEGQMPTMKMLRESGNIEQDADGIIFLHSPTNENDKSIDPRDKASFHDLTQNSRRYLCLGVAKQRNGAVGQVCVIFDPKVMRYMQITRFEPEGK